MEPLKEKTRKGSQVYSFLLIAFILVLIGGCLYFITGSGGGEKNYGLVSIATRSLDSFAKCLTEKGFIMYGLYSCSHCQEEKNLFGSSFQYITYIECTEDPQRCAADDINAVPTWRRASSSPLVGLQSLKELSAASGCPLPEGF